MLDYVIRWINDPVIQQLAALLAIAAAAGAGLQYLYSWNRERLRKKISYRRITGYTRRVDRDDIHAALELHASLFPHGRLTDRPDEIIRWIKEHEQDILGGEEIEWDEQLIVAKSGAGKIVGYLYASFHRLTRYVFISYFGTVNTTWSALSRIGKNLLGHLLACIENTEIEPFEKTGRKFRAVVAELDLEKDEGDYAFRLAEYFGGLANELGYKAYIIDGVEYAQPIVRLPEIRQKRRSGIKVPAAGPQLLLYIPAASTATVDFLSRIEVEDIYCYAGVCGRLPDG
jgi:hypothetical protein